MLGEDIEFSMRLSSKGLCAFVPEAVAHHLPPGGSGVEGETRLLMKFSAMVQNLAFYGRVLAARQTVAPLSTGKSREIFEDVGWLGRKEILAPSPFQWFNLGEPSGEDSGRRIREEIRGD